MLKHSKIYNILDYRLHLPNRAMYYYIIILFIYAFRMNHQDIFQQMQILARINKLKINGTENNADINNTFL